VRNKIKAIKGDYWAKFTSDMDHDLYGAPKKVWKMLKNRKKPVIAFYGFDFVSHFCIFGVFFWRW